MADVIFIAITIAFFVLCVLYVNWCDRIIGPDEFGPAAANSDAGADEPVSEEVPA